MCQTNGGDDSEGRFMDSFYVFFDQSVEFAVLVSQDQLSAPFPSVSAEQKRVPDPQAAMWLAHLIVNMPALFIKTDDFDRVLRAL